MPGTCIPCVGVAHASGRAIAIGFNAFALHLDSKYTHLGEPTDHGFKSHYIRVDLYYVLSTNPLATLSSDPGSPSVVSVFAGGWI